MGQTQASNDRASDYKDEDQRRATSNVKPHAFRQQFHGNINGLMSERQG